MYDDEATAPLGFFLIAKSNNSEVPYLPCSLDERSALEVSVSDAPLSVLGAASETDCRLTRKCCLMEQKMDIAGKLWDLGNYITAFAIAQGLAISFAIGKKEMRLLDNVLAHVIAFVATLVFTTCYAAAVLWCGYEGASSQPPENQHIWHLVTGAQIVAVGLFTALVLVALKGNLKATFATTSKGSSSSRK